MAAPATARPCGSGGLIRHGAHPLTKAARTSWPRVKAHQRTRRRRCDRRYTPAAFDLRPSRADAARLLGPSRDQSRIGAGRLPVVTRVGRDPFSAWPDAVAIPGRPRGVYPGRKSPATWTSSVDLMPRPHGLTDIDTSHLRGSRGGRDTAVVATLLADVMFAHSGDPSLAVPGATGLRGRPEAASAAGPARKTGPTLQRRHVY